MILMSVILSERSEINGVSPFPVVVILAAHHVRDAARGKETLAVELQAAAATHA